LGDLADALKELDELNDALIQVRQGKVPKFHTPLGDLAERLTKWANSMEGRTSPPVGLSDKPWTHDPGHAIDEFNQHLQDLRADQSNEQRLRDTVARDRRILNQQEAAAKRLTESLKVLSEGPLPHENLRPVVEKLWLDSDTLEKAVASCGTMVKRMQTSLDSSLDQLGKRIANLQATLNNPNIRSFMNAVDQSNAALSRQVTASIQTTREELANRDRSNATTTQYQLQHPYSAPPPPRTSPDLSPTPQMTPLPPSDCPAGFKNMGGVCVRAEMHPTYPN
jgi:uncharacterized coiled-coil protein SlyX